MQLSKINKTTEQFLNWSFSGNGKYYTTEQRSRSYGNTLYQNFINRNPETVLRVTETGNDAPRGGATGNYHIVEFTPEFLKLAEDFKAAKQVKEQAIADAKKAEDKQVAEYAALIDKIEGEDYVATAGRLGAAIGVKVESHIFNKAVKAVRRK